VIARRRANEREDTNEESQVWIQQYGLSRLSNGGFAHGRLLSSTLSSSGLVSSFDVLLTFSMLLGTQKKNKNDLVQIFQQLLACKFNARNCLSNIFIQLR